MIATIQAEAMIGEHAIYLEPIGRLVFAAVSHSGEYKIRSRDMSLLLEQLEHLLIPTGSGQNLHPRTLMVEKVCRHHVSMLKHQRHGQV